MKFAWRSHKKWNYRISGWGCDDAARGYAKEVVKNIKARVEEINDKEVLPGGLKIVPYYDRSELVNAAINTGSEGTD